MTLHELSERLKRVRMQKKSLSETLKGVEDEEKILCRDLLAILQESNMSRADANGLKLARVPKEIFTPDPEHWMDIFQFVADSGHWQIIRKQLNTTAVAELFRAGETLPFVERSEIDELKVADLR